MAERTDTRWSWRARLVATLVPLMIVGALGVTAHHFLSGISGELPARVAVHWGASGAPDRFVSLDSALVENGVVVGLLTLLLSAIAWVPAAPVSATAGLATGLGFAMASGMYGSLYEQRGLTDVTQADAFGWTVVAGLVAGVLLGAGVARVLHSMAASAYSSTGLPADAVRLEVPDGTRLAWSGRMRLSRTTLGVLGLALIPLLGMAVFLFAAGSQEGWILLGVALFPGLVMWALSGDVFVDRDLVRVQRGPLKTMSLALEEISSADVVTVKPLREYGGWGWRIGRDAHGFITRSGEALRLHRVGDVAYVLTVDRAEDAAAVVNTLLDQRSRAETVAHPG